MEHYHKHSDLLDGIKDRIKDGEYKMLMESLSKIRDIKKEVYVKVKRISPETTIYTRSVSEIIDGEETYESEIHHCTERYAFDVCRADCECGECSREPLRTVEIKTKMKEETIWMKVVEDKLFKSKTLLICRNISS